MTERSEEAHHVAEFHMVRGESLRVREELRPEVRASQITDTLRDAPPGLSKGLTEPLKTAQYGMCKQRTSIIERV